MKGKNSITAVDEVNGDTVETYVHEFTDPAVVTGIKVNTYRNQQYALQYSFEKLIDGNTPSNLLQSLGRSFIAGNGGNFELPVRERFEAGDKLRITVENTTGRNGATAYKYHANARVEADYDAAAVEDGVASQGLTDLLSGVFS